jgi:hypothetical protein
MMLDTFCVAETWRRHLLLPPFSALLNERLSEATAWLRLLVDPLTGDAPNLGANDGSNLLPLTSADNRDFRPAVQLASILFQDASAYPDTTATAGHIRWLSVTPSKVSVEPQRSKVFDYGGYAVLKMGEATAVLRYPRFRFRPSHADALHVDLWVAGRNLLRDAGSFSYNADAELAAYFSGAQGHSTVQFDGREQMPRLGRFLWGDWLDTKSLSPIVESHDAINVAAAYEDRQGVTHLRELELRQGSLKVRDTVTGFSRAAVLRWRLEPAAWVVTGSTLSSAKDNLLVSADVPFSRFEIVTGWESRYYMQKYEVPVLEVELFQPGVIESEYRWVK